jgi:subtilisin family serine protease
MKTKIIMTLAALGATLTAHPILAHHSFAAEFDANSPIDLTGTVTKVAWANPHTFFYIDVENDRGQIETWALEMGSPNGLMRRGWTRDSMKIGDVVNVTGSRAKDGSLKGNARSVVLSSGEKLFAGSSQGSDDANCGALE